MCIRDRQANNTEFGLTGGLYSQKSERLALAREDFHVGNLYPVSYTHLGDERRAVGLAEVVSDPYPDPQANDARLVVIDLRPLHALAQPISLAAVKADPFFADFALVREARLSVMPVSQEQWDRLLAMAGE